MLRKYRLYFVLLLLVGCASSPEAILKNGYDSASAAAKTTTVLVNRDAISVPQAERVSDLAKVSKATLDDGAERLRLCRATPGAKCDNAVANINLGSGVLMEVEKFLKDMEAAK